MKQYIILGLVLLMGISYASQCYAQAPHIDSMAIDESKGILYIHGSFGWLPGLVEVDSVRMNIVNWTDTLIGVGIPSTGHGSAGAILVGAGGYPSNIRFLTKVIYGGTVEHYVIDIKTGSWIPSGGSSFSGSWRYDYHSFFVNHKYEGLHFDDVSYDFKYDFIHVDEYLFGMKNDYDIFGISGLPIKATIHEKWIEDGYADQFFFPPHTARALFRKVDLINPVNDSANLDKWNINLIWDTLKYADTNGYVLNYRVQISSDTNLAKILIDTTISSFSFHSLGFSDNTMYFWRVAGINSEGQSRWSDTWNFTTSEQSQVIKDVEQQPSFIIYPNPATKELNISSMLLAGKQARIILYDLQGRLIRTALSNTAIKWDVSQLANGSYILACITDTDHLSKMINVLH